MKALFEFIAYRLPRLVFAAIGCAAGAAITHAAPAPVAPQPVHVLAFDGAWNLPVWVAQKRGFFVRRGIDVSLGYVAGSVALMRQMSEGTAQIALTSVDNVLAYSQGQGESGKQDAPDIVAIFGGDHGGLALVSQPGITRIDDLVGHSVTVDAMTTGFAFALRDILASGRIDLNRIDFVAAGGTDRRYEDLIAGNHDATLLRPPYQYLAADRGFHIVADVSGALSPYLGTVGAVRQSWASGNRQTVVAFLAAYREALGWIFDQRHASQSIALIREHYPALSEAAALKTYAALMSPKDGLIRDMRIDRAGLKTVVSLRGRYAPTANQRHGAVFDEKYLDALGRK